MHLSGCAIVYEQSPANLPHSCVNCPLVSRQSSLSVADIYEIMKTEALYSCSSGVGCRSNLTSDAPFICTNQQ
jgi:hypothetical protein